MSFPHQTLKAVFVDLDGTLVDSIPKLLKIYLAFLKDFGIEGSIEEFSEINGPSLPEFVQILKMRYHLPQTLQELILLYKTELLYIYCSPNLLMPGALVTLKLLQSRGIKLVLVTSATLELVNLILTQLELADLFQEIISGDMVSQGKPHPDIYQLALARTKLLPHQAVVIEDSTNGLKSALAAGIYTLRLNQAVQGKVWHEGWGEMGSWNEMMGYFKEKCL